MSTIPSLQQSTTRGISRWTSWRSTSKSPDIKFFGGFTVIDIEAYRSRAAVAPIDMRHIDGRTVHSRNEARHLEDAACDLVNRGDGEPSVTPWLPARISRGYPVVVRKVLVSLPETDLRVIDAAARKAGETRSSFVRRAALAEARRTTRPIDDPATHRAFSGLVSRAERRKPISTADALAARDRGRRWATWSSTQMRQI